MGEPGRLHRAGRARSPSPINYALSTEIQTLLNDPLARLRTVGMMEGASFLLLLGVAMPLKYLAGMPQMVRVVGMIHGVLFLLYVAAVFQASVALRWPMRRVAAALIAAVLPFGPFVFDAHLRRDTAPGA